MRFVCYKFKHENPEVSYRVIDLNENYITVGDLKKQICSQNKLVQSKKSRFDLLIKDAEGDEDYTDDKTLIPSHRRVIVMRIPIHPPERKETFKPGDDVFAGIPLSLRGVDHSKWVPPPIVEKKPEIGMCGICEDEINDLAMTPCCSRISCYQCITDELLNSNEGECPYCHKEGIRPLSIITASEIAKSEDLKKTSKHSTSFEQPIVSPYVGRAIASQPLRPTHTYTDPQPSGSVVRIYPGKATMGSHEYGITSHQPNPSYYDRRMKSTHYSDPQWGSSIPPNPSYYDRRMEPTHYSDPQWGRSIRNPQPAYIDTLAEFEKYLAKKDREKASRRIPEDASRPYKRDRSDPDDSSKSDSKSKRSRHEDD